MGLPPPWFAFLSAMLKHIMTACQRFIQEIIIAPPMTTPAFASLQRSSDHQFGHLEHIDRFLPGRYDLRFMPYSITCGKQAITEILHARTRCEQPAQHGSRSGRRRSA